MSGGNGTGVNPVPWAGLLTDSSDGGHFGLLLVFLILDSN